MGTKGVEHYLGRILDEAAVEVYAATNTVMLDYPLRLGRINESSPTVSGREGTHYILDSGIGDDSYTNADVLDRAKHLGADVVVPADVFGEPRATTRRILELLDLLNRDERYEDYDPNVLLPIQGGQGLSHVDHYEVLADRLETFGYDVDDYLLALGGLKDGYIHDQLRAAIGVRNAAGEDAHIHLFGFGFSYNWAVVFNRAPDLVDSLDTGTVAQHVVNGRVIDSEFNRMPFKRPRGTCSTALSVLLRKYHLYVFNHLISPLVREEDRPTAFRATNGSVDVGELERLLRRRLDTPEVPGTVSPATCD